MFDTVQVLFVADVLSLTVDQGGEKRRRMISEADLRGCPVELLFGFDHSVEHLHSAN